MDFNQISELQKELDAGETLLWTGQPKKGIILRLADVFLIPFSLLWCGITVISLYFAISNDAPRIFIFLVSIFVLIGLFFVLGRFIADALYRKNAIYGITEKRILLRGGIFFRKTYAYQISDLGPIECDLMKNGIGNIYLKVNNSNMKYTYNMPWWKAKNYVPTLDHIEDVEQVFEKIILLKEKYEHK